MPNPSTIVAPTPVAIYTGTHWDALTLQPDLRPVSVRTSLSPGKSQATIASDYGMVSTGGPFRQVAPVDLAGKLVQIRLGTAPADRVVFEGIVRNQSMQPAGTFDLLTGAVPNGQVLHYVEGLESILDRVYLRHTVTATNGIVNELFAFNGDGNRLERNRSLIQTIGPSGSSYVFDWAADATTWSALDIADYLAVYATEDTGIQWYITGETGCLALLQRQPSISENKSVRQILNEIAKPEYGFCWKVERFDATTYQIVVLSLSDVDIMDLDGATVLLPANPNAVQLGETSEYDRSLDPPTITKLSESTYAHIEVRGEPVRVVATLQHTPANPAWSPFAANWDTSLEAPFLAAEDKDRQTDAYEDVYARFRIRTDWDGINYYDAIGLEIATGLPPQFLPIMLAPLIDPATVAVAFDELTPGTQVPAAIVFERTYPDANGDERKPVLRLASRRDVADFNIGGETVPTWQWQEPVRSEENEIPPVGVEMLDTGPELRLKCRSNVVLAPPEWDGGSDYAPAWHPSVDGFAVRLSWYSHEILRQTIDTGVGEGTKRIDAPGLHLWVDADAFSAPGGVILLRDDRDTLRRLAKLVATWYGRERSTLSIASRIVPSASRLGYMVTQAYSGGAWTPIGTPITTESYTWDTAGELTYGLETSFADLDWSRVARRNAMATERDIRRRVRRLESRLSSPSLLSPYGRKEDDAFTVRWADANILTVTARYSYWYQTAVYTTDQTYRFVFDPAYPRVGEIVFFHRHDIEEVLYSAPVLNHWPLYWYYTYTAAGVTGDTATEALRRDSRLLSGGPTRPTREFATVACVANGNQAGATYVVPPAIGNGQGISLPPFGIRAYRQPGAWKVQVALGGTPSVTVSDGATASIYATGPNAGYTSALATAPAAAPNWSRLIGYISIDADGKIRYFDHWVPDVLGITRTNA